MSQLRQKKDDTNGHCSAKPGFEPRTLMVEGRDLNTTPITPPFKLVVHSIHEKFPNIHSTTLNKYKIYTDASIKNKKMSNRRFHFPFIID